MNTFITNVVGGPGFALIRYAIAAGGGALVARGYLTAADAQAIGGAMLTILATGIGALGASRSVRVAKVVGSSAVESVVLTNGQTITKPEDVKHSNL